MTGTLKSFSDKHGYGFIVGDQNEIFFAHKLHFRYKYPKPGDKVIFEPKKTEKGMRATNIRRAYEERGKERTSGKEGRHHFLSGFSGDKGEHNKRTW